MRLQRVRRACPGLLESLYEEAVCRELVAAGFTVERQKPVPVIYKGEPLANDLRLDIIVDGKVILELKSVTEYRKLFEKQLYTYLRLTGWSSTSTRRTCATASTLSVIPTPSLRNDSYAYGLYGLKELLALREKRLRTLRTQRTIHKVLKVRRKRKLRRD